MANYNNQYLTLVAKGSGQLQFKASNNQTYSYSTNEGSTWVTGNSATTIAVNNGDRVMFKGTLTPNGGYGIGRFSLSTADFEAEGNIMSLLFGDNFIGQTSLSGKQFAFRGLFYGCSGLTSIENLKLPATTLANDCYEDMFYGCTSLTSIPSDLLLATSLASGCYEQMFSHCTSLTSIPSGLLLATTLANRCYGYMFANCTSLTSIPSGLLPATTLAYYCYGSMFMGCASLTTVPSGLLPATTLANYCYYSMFSNCTSLTTAPNLPATTLANSCYGQMFNGCTSLNEITCLATDISADNCTTSWVYNVASSGTFYKSPSMNDWTRSTSGIPVTWNVEDYEPPSGGYCKYYKEQQYVSYDKGVTWSATSETRRGDLIEQYSIDCGYVPLELWVTTSGYECSGTTKMTQEKKVITFDDGETWVDSDPLETRAALPVIEYDSEDCGYVPPIPSEQYLTLVAKGSGNLKFTITSANSQYYYSTNNGVSWTSGNSATTIAVSTNDRVMFKGTLTPICGYNTYGIGTFSSTTLFEAEGNVMSLAYGDNFIGQTSLEGNNCVFETLFKNCTSLTSIENLKLPATTLTESCYAYMFRGCTSLTSIPSGFLPSTTLADRCYDRMFVGCTSLTSVPEDLLPATALTYVCYYNMFSDCTSLATPPNLPATTLGTLCYQGMFQGCTSLEKAPILPATTLATQCYNCMFRGCTNLSEITCYATDISAEDCTNSWVTYVASSGTFKTPSSTNWTTGTSGIPNGWTRVDI